MSTNTAKAVEIKSVEDISLLMDRNLCIELKRDKGQIYFIVAKFSRAKMALVYNRDSGEAEFYGRSDIFAMWRNGPEAWGAISESSFSLALVRLQVMPKKVEAAA